MFKNLWYISFIILINFEASLSIRGRKPKLPTKEEEFPILNGPGSGLWSASASAQKACRCLAREYCQENINPGQGVWTPRNTRPNWLKSNFTRDRKGQLGVKGIKSRGVNASQIRIVNRPVRDEQLCQPGEIYCCTGHGPEPTYPPGPDDLHPHRGCGTRRPIRVNGFHPEHGMAMFGNYPWLAVIVGQQNNFIGAGALLDNYHVLTAAHKVKDHHLGAYKIRLGEWNANAEDEPYRYMQVEVNKVDVHPGFNPQNLHNDVAILRLAHPISTTTFPHINSVCMPNPSSSFVGSRCWVAGYGKDDFKDFGKYSHILREVDVPILDANDCEMRLRRTSLGSSYSLHRTSFMCAGGEEGKDACTGDGGSPLVCQGSDGRFHVVGLVAWGIGCADIMVPGIYVNVMQYVQWIQSKLTDGTSYVDRRSSSLRSLKSNKL